MSTFTLTRIGELHRQLMLSPADVRGRYADRLERFLLELEPALTYSYEFVYFRIAGVRLDASRLDTFTGAELTPDLLLLLEALSEGAPPLVTDAGEELYAIEDLRARFGVTARTIRRWRQRGLVSRRYEFPDGVRRTGVRRSALERFVQANLGTASVTGRSPRLTAREEEEILRRLARYRERGLTTTAAAARVATEVGRARETVRKVLKRREGTGEPRPGRLGRRERQELLAGFRKGARAEALAARSGRSPASVYRILNQERARELLAQPVAYVGGADFAAPGAQARILGEELRGLTERLESAPSALGREEERALFRAYNYTKFLILQTRQKLDPRRYVPTRALRELQELSAGAARLRDLLVRLHLPLVDRIVRQHAAGPAGAPELTAKGGALLGELVDAFDYTGRGRFAARVTLHLQKAFARTIAEGPR